MKAPSPLTGYGKGLVSKNYISTVRNMDHSMYDIIFFHLMFTLPPYALLYFHLKFVIQGKVTEVLFTNCPVNV